MFSPSNQALCLSPFEKQLHPVKACRCPGFRCGDLSAKPYMDRHCCFNWSTLAEWCWTNAYVIHIKITWLATLIFFCCIRSKLFRTKLWRKLRFGPSLTCHSTQFPFKGVLGVKGVLGPRARARQGLEIEAFYARARTQDPINPEDLFQGTICYSQSSICTQWHREKW